MDEGKLFSFELNLTVRPTGAREVLGFEAKFSPEQAGFKSMVRFTATEEGKTEGIEQLLQAIAGHVDRYMALRRHQETRNQEEVKVALWEVLDLSLVEVNLKFPEGSGRYGQFKIHTRVAKRFLAAGVEFMGQLVTLSQFELQRLLPTADARRHFEYDLSPLGLRIGMTPWEVYQWQPRAVRYGG